MGIAGFPYLGIPLNLTEPAYLEHVSSVFLISLRICWRNWPLLIDTLQLFKSSFYWSPRITQLFSFGDQVKEFILASRSDPDQVILYPLSSLYKPPHSVPFTLTLGPFIAYDHSITTMVNITPSRAWLLFLAPSGAESSIHMDSCFSSSEKKPWTDLLPLGDNHSSKSWSICLWYWNSPSINLAMV